MTYKNILDYLEEVATSHHFVETYGYGALSDIAVPDNEEPPNYPYVFVNPQGINNGRNSFSADLNLIVMTQVKDTEEKEIEGQDKCIQIIQDIVSIYTNTNNDPLMDIETPFSITVFKERFQDDVVGATAAITINYAKAIDGCDTPFDNIANIPSASCPQAIVTDGDGSEHLVDAGGTYTCLPATAKSGIFYQRQLPWANNDSGYDYLVTWQLANGAYDYTPPTNPELIAALPNDYVSSDAGALLLQNNRFGNKYRFTNDIGQQYIERFAESSENNSNNKRYCIDHLLGLGWYVEDAYTDRVQRNIRDAAEYVNLFSYAGYSDWRLCDMAEYLNAVNYHDYVNSYGGVYCPFVDPFLRNYGGQLWTGTYSKDNQYLFVNTNGGTISGTSSATATNGHLLMCRNEY